MKKIAQLYVVLLPLLMGVASCQFPSDRLEPNANTVKTNRKTFTDHLPDYGTYANHICNVEISYLSIDGSRLMTDTLLQLVVNSLNEQTYNQALLLRHPAAKLNLDTASWTFKMGFHNRMLAQGSTQSRCDFKVRQDSCFFNEKLISIAQQTTHYENGKYLAGERRFVNFDRFTNRPMPASQYIENQAEVERVAADVANRTMQEGASQRNIKAQFTRLPLPKNIGVKQDGLHFFYTPMERVAYGLTEGDFIIPYSEIRAFIRLDVLGIPLQP